MPLLNNILNVIGSVDPSGVAGIMDGYESAIRAWSLTKLFTGHTGALVRIRKDISGQPEKDFYPDSNGELSLNSTDGAGTSLSTWIGSSDGYIVTLYGQGTGNVNAVQSVTANQPLIVSAGVVVKTATGKPAMDLNNDWLTFTIMDSVTCSVIVVLKADTPGVVTGTFGGQTNSTSNWLNVQSTLHSIRGNGTEVTFASSSNTTLQIFEFYKNGTNFVAYKNGTLLGTSSAIGGGGFIMGALGMGLSGARYFDGKIAACLLLNTDKRSETATIRGLLNDHYAAY